METITDLITPAALLFSVCVFLVVLMMRRGVLALAPVFSEKKVWRDFLLPISPIVFGALAALLIQDYPYPDIVRSDATRVMFGMGAGLVAAHAYKTIKGSCEEWIKALGKSIKDRFKKDDGPPPDLPSID
jgi:hypothetical protein